jgi:hypothetical protein
MTYSRIREALMTLGTWLVLGAAVTFAGVTDSSVKVPANYSSLQPPSAGSTYVDGAFGTTIKRLSNALATPDAADGGTLTWVVNEYSTPALWNSNNTRLLLQHDSYYGIYDTNGTFLKNAPLDINASTEPRWSRTDNNVVYYKRGNQLKQYNVATDAIGVVRTFTEYSSIGGRGESDICFDGDHMVIVGDNRDVFVYTFSTNQKGPVFNTAVGGGFDSVYISANDDVTISWLANGTGRYQGIELFNKNMGFLRQVTHGGGHMDMGRDVNGDPVLIWTNSNDPQPICNNGIVKVRLADGQQTCVAGLQLDWSLAVHISGSDNGWAVVSTYAPSDPMPGSFWPAYTNEVFRMKLDGSVVERLAHHRSRPFDDYVWMSKASINRDGTRIVYSSNFGLSGKPTYYSDAYMINLGGGGSTPTSTPTAAPTSTPRPTPTSGGTSAPTATATARPSATPTPVPTTGGTPTTLEQTNPAVQLTELGRPHA